MSEIIAGIAVFLSLIAAAFVKGRKSKQGEIEGNRAKEVIQKVKEGKKSDEEVDSYTDDERIAELLKSADD